MARNKANWGIEQEQHIELLLRNYETTNVVDLKEVSEELGYALTSIRKHTSILAKKLDLSVAGIWTHDSITVSRLTDKERELIRKRTERDDKKSRGVSDVAVDTRDKRTTFVVVGISKVDGSKVTLKIKALDEKQAKTRAINLYKLSKVLSTHTHEEYKRNRKSYGLIAQREYV